MAEKKGIEKFKDELIKNANYIVRKGKGLLAADESTNTIVKKKKKIGRNVSSESTLTANKNEEIENILDKINKFNGE